MNYNILIIDPVPIVSIALKDILKNEQYTILHAISKKDIISVLNQIKIDLVILEIENNCVLNFELFDFIRNFSNNLKIIIFTSSSNQTKIKEVLKNYNYIFLKKSSNVFEIKHVLNGAITIFNRKNSVYTKINSFENLTEIEKQLLCLYINGYTINEITNLLFQSIHEIENCCKNILQKLKLNNFSELNNFLNVL